MINLSLLYPNFRRFLVLRAARRRAHFLKIFHEIQQAAELESKKTLQRQTNTTLADLDGLDTNLVSDAAENTSSMVNMVINETRMTDEALKKLLLADIEKAIYRVQRKLVKPGKKFTMDPLSLRSRILSID